MASQTLSSSVNWIQFPGFPGLYYNVLEVDPDDRFVQLLMMFEPGVQCIPHRHIGPVQTLVLEGEHLIYEVDDPSKLTDRRPAGSYSTHSGDESHIEGGGDEGGGDELLLAGVPRKMHFFRGTPADVQAEGGGDEGAVILLSMESKDGQIWETYNDQLQVDRVSVTEDFRRGLRKQAAQG